MKLSDAIRLGAMLAPQGFGEMRDEATGATCALGAAQVAMGEGAFAICLSNENRQAECPVKGCYYHGRMQCFVDNLIAHLNDIHRWTREAIADWLDTVDTQPVAQDQVHAEDRQTLAHA